MSWQTLRTLVHKGWWVIHHPFERQDPRYWRVQLMQSLLFILQVYSGAFVVLNLTLFGYFDIAIANLCVFVAILSIQIDLRKNLNLERSAILLTGTIVVFMAVYLAIAQGRNYSFIWLSLIPTISFFLLGIRRGLYISACSLTAAIVFIVVFSPDWPSYELNMPSYFNIALSLFALLTISRHYEKSRTEAFAFLAKRNQELEILAVTDPLTQLFNRSHLDAMLEIEIRRAKRDSFDLSVLIIDADQFKTLNDSYGHLVGDEVLVELSGLLQNSTRATDVLGRWGGEEFLIIAPKTDQDGAVELAEKIRVAVGRHRFTHDDLHLTLSIGSATLSPNDTPVSIIQRADEGLYQAKHDGRNCTRLGKSTA
ncbi:GGDEF domain-containing protein [Pseudidiomarina sp.]|uniref:GGDEF domain-containing protein n=1 Tax=Pseudidiomarina sp. TaxID=2081707 RepID=UPI003A97A446